MAPGNGTGWGQSRAGGPPAGDTGVTWGLRVPALAELRELGGCSSSPSPCRWCHPWQSSACTRSWWSSGPSSASLWQPRAVRERKGLQLDPPWERGGHRTPPHLAVPLTWLPEMSGAEGMRCSASRCCSIPVSSCSLAWHSDSSARGTGVREGARSTPARPHAPPRAPLTGRAALQPLAVLQPGVHLVPGAGQRGQGRGAARGQDPRPLALQQGTEGMDGCQEPLTQVLSPRAVTHLCVGSPLGTRLRPLAVVVGAEAADPAGEQLRGLDLGDRGELVGDLMSPTLSHRSSSLSTVAP